MAKRTTKAPAPITGARIFSMPTASGTAPALIFKGDVPAAGTVLRATLANGVTYRGTVADATEADGEVLVEFKDGLSPVPTE